MARPLTGCDSSKLLSPTTIVPVDTSAASRDSAAELGADATLDREGADVVEEIESMSAESDLDFVVINQTLTTAAGSVDRPGLVSVVGLGLGGGVLSFSFLRIASEATVIGSA